MEYLSWLFFCLSPFALFCSENGNGLVLCPIFILLGFVCKCVGNNNENTSQTTVKVEPQEFWEWHYKDRMRSTLAEKDSINDGLMALKDQEARSWATTICGYHNAWVPPGATQEKIARKNGVITKEMIKERNEKKDRIQVGKYFLMMALMEEYRGTKIGRGGIEGCCYPDMVIKRDIDKIKTSNYRMVSDYWTQCTYNKTIREVWESLSMEEKNQAKIWVKEYDKRLMEVVKEYVDRKRYNTEVEIDF